MRKTVLFEEIPFHLISEEEFIDKVGGWIRKGAKKRVCYMNVHGVVLASENREYLRVLESADLIYPDGWGPVIAQRIIKGEKGERINAADFIDELLQLLNGGKCRIFLLGAEREVLRKVVKYIEKGYKNINICGTWHGYFKEAESGAVVRKVKMAKPNLVLVGMGSPKQEYWIDENYSKLPKAVYWSVGGLLHYLAGTRSRAPQVMRKVSLEWLYRLLQEPRRLGYRYTVENVKFVVLLLRSLVDKSV